MRALQFSIQMPSADDARSWTERVRSAADWVANSTIVTPSSGGRILSSELAAVDGSPAGAWSASSSA